ncbi:hypothetical protein [Phytopseudomonas punonensis]|uniref:Uncharacterized protein n=1 Tax=Phytopseudomonas punonensis TaxID=1220495 RepID=A0A1M7F0S9_9GAMM|nr:hypothetical protein [Pseudomonas punonensis]SHL97694.1 hypothetical protein SAMN05216288_2726 [Pseudomonas punonensis]
MSRKAGAIHFSEKVFDYEVLYSPSTKDSVGLIFGASTPLLKMISQNCEFLNINNIRLLKKIELFASLLSENLKGSQDLVVEQACRILPLAVLAIYGERRSKVSLDFILSHGNSRTSHILGSEPGSEDTEAAQIEAEKTSFLQEYGFIRCSEFDLAIINLVKKGYADEDLLREVVEEIEKKILHDNDVALLRDAWKIYNSSFLDNEVEVMQAFEHAIAVGLDKFSLEDLDSVAFLYCGLGREVEIKGVIDKFFSEIYPRYGVSDKDEIFQWPNNSYVRQCLDVFFEGLVLKGGVAEFIQAAFDNPSKSFEIIKGLADQGEDDFYHYFASLNDPDFSFHARLVLRLGNTSFPNQDDALVYGGIFVKAFAALNRLSGTTPLNKLRMRKFKSYESLYLRELRKIEAMTDAKAEAAKSD